MIEITIEDLLDFLKKETMNAMELDDTVRLSKIRVTTDLIQEYVEEAKDKIEKQNANTSD